MLQSCRVLFFLWISLHIIIWVVFLVEAFLVPLLLHLDIRIFSIEAQSWSVPTTWPRCRHFWRGVVCVVGRTRSVSGRRCKPSATKEGCLEEAAEGSIHVSESVSAPGSSCLRSSWGWPAVVSWCRWRWRWRWRCGWCLRCPGVPRPLPPSLVDVALVVGSFGWEEKQTIQVRNNYWDMIYLKCFYALVACASFILI